MSHFTTIQTKIRDLDALRDACVELGVRLVPDSTARGYAGVVRPAPHVIKLRGPYDIAVNPAPENDGTYGMTTDWWDGHVAKEVGPNYGLLLQAYGATRRSARPVRAGSAPPAAPKPTAPFW
jgi:hypothetical protein